MDSLLDLWYQQECEDPRDMVFGLLGLRMMPTAMDVRPDYKKTSKEVFEDVLLEVDCSVSQSAGLDREKIRHNAPENPPNRARAL